MKTLKAQDRVDAFRKDLQAVLDKYKANMTIEEPDSSTYFRQQEYIEVEIPAVYDDQGECLAEGVVFSQGTGLYCN